MILIVSIVVTGALLWVLVSEHIPTLLFPGQEKCVTVSVDERNLESTVRAHVSPGSFAGLRVEGPGAASTSKPGWGDGDWVYSFRGAMAGPNTVCFTNLTDHIIFERLTVYANN
ncbi:hypothetical protein [Lysinibacter cavernae]|uniref:Uncharacterized protein n=1 Tax=Lysinibacter cavernae TaxID=1640652 RepID=A0A7X5QZ67_9MICO|nr:hypothetical protein [Lysinibacter cavernae]NIH52572.1 hypothetical protein [Lysinibacter cavernae]